MEKPFRPGILSKSTGTIEQNRMRDNRQLYIPQSSNGTDYATVDRFNNLLFLKVINCRLISCYCLQAIFLVQTFELVPSEAYRSRQTTPAPINYE
jgi:hypothetical protein